MKRLLHRTAHELERRLDRRAAGRAVTRQLVLSPYRGFGREDELLIRGRLLVDKRITRAISAESVWRNVLNTYRRFSSDEVGGARVVGSYRQSVVETVTDDEGHFQIRLQPGVIGGEPATQELLKRGEDTTPHPPSAPSPLTRGEGLSREVGAETLLPSTGGEGARRADEGSGDASSDPSLSVWREVQLHVPDTTVSAVAHVLVPGPDAHFGVISDIDDTIVQTNATSLLRMARSIINNAAARLPFEGVADLYRALHSGRNPIFYVSSSPWNLYEVLHDYMNITGIPHGPMFLQDWGIDEDTLILASHTEHKLAQIATLVEYYPDLKFVLIGDSGQHDPEIYLRVIQMNPGRILAAFIRDVTPDLRDRAVTKILEQSNAAGVEMLYVRDSAEAMTHARRLGLIS